MTRGSYALIVVDVQNDFCKGGALAVKGGDEVIAPLNNLIDALVTSDVPIFFTRDWHPRNHCSFRAYGGPWPPHCVKDTKGAAFHPRLRMPKRAMIISKATKPDKESYSDFEGTKLASTLREMGVTELLVGGLATDYCVKYTVGDGLKEGFRVNVLTDCIRGVNLRSTDSKNALSWMKAKGAKETTSERVLKMMSE
jgi:nicotinamidase/pyrazinamidase